jgi:ADP-ribosylglycohydrolase
MKEEFLFEHVQGGLAVSLIGDALGSATEALSPDEIQQVFGGKVTTFQPPPEGTPAAKSGRAVGQLTDDTTEMLEMVEAMIDSGGQLKIEEVVKHLLKWAENEVLFDSFAGPSTRKAIKRLREGDDPHKTGLPPRKYWPETGLTDGAAMKVAPAGLAHPGDLDAAIQDAVTMSIPTHHTDVAFAGAAATAAAIAQALVPGTTPLAVADAAIYGAQQGYEIGKEDDCVVYRASIVDRIRLALRLVAGEPDFDQACLALANTIGCGLPIIEAVPTGIGIFVAGRGDPNLAVIGAANIGGDADTVGAITGGIAGAYAGIEAVDEDLYGQMVEANDLDIEDITRRLVAVIDTGV